MKFEQGPEEKIEREGGIGLPENTIIPKELQNRETGEERLSPEEAQHEADMIRVKLKEALKHEPTLKDYRNAYKAVEEMKGAAFGEPVGEYLFFKLLQIGNKYFQGAAEGIESSLGQKPKSDEKVKAMRESSLICLTTKWLACKTSRKKLKTSVSKRTANREAEQKEQNQKSRNVSGH